MRYHARKIVVVLGSMGVSALLQGNVAASDYCAYLRLNASSRSLGLAQPFLFSQQILDHRGPREDLEAERNLRVGLGIDFKKLAQMWHEFSYADAECSRAQAQDEFVGTLDSIATVIERVSVRARERFLVREIEIVKNEMTTSARLWEARTIGLADVFDLKKRKAVLDLKLVEVRTQLRKLDNNPASEAPLTTSIDTLRLKLLHKSQDAYSLATSLRDDRPWNLTLMVGKERMASGTGGRHFDSGVLYAALELRVQFLSPIAFYQRDELDHARAAWLQSDPAGPFRRGDDLLLDLRGQLIEAQDKTKILSDHIQELNAMRDKLRPGNEATRPLYEQLSHELLFARMDLEYSRTKAETLQKIIGSETKEGVAKPPEATEFVATSGSIAPTSVPHTFRSESDKMRARYSGVPSHRMAVRFTYSGPTDELQALGSGAERAQFGVYLLASNQCNLLYVMIRIQDDGDQVVVQRKNNPGKATHGDCGNEGYTTIKPELSSKLPLKIRVGTSLGLVAVVENSVLTVHIDNQLVWRGAVPVPADDRDTYAGIRSDNVKIEFVTIPTTF